MQNLILTDVFSSKAFDALNAALTMAAMGQNTSIIVIGEEKRGNTISPEIKEKLEMCESFGIGVHCWKTSSDHHSKCLTGLAPVNTHEMQTMIQNCKHCIHL